MRCPTCLLLPCMCDAIPRVTVRTRFVVIRHAREMNKGSNSARLAAMAMGDGCRVLDYGTPTPFRPEDVPWEGAALLFPDVPEQPFVEPPGLVVVLDGSWPQARRMAQRIGPVRGLPRIHVTARDEDRLRMRKPPVEGGLATLEAIARVVARFEGEEAARPLEELFDEQTRRIRTARGV